MHFFGSGFHLLSTQASSERDSVNSHQNLLALYGRDVSLVQRMRMREKTLLQRMTAQQRQRERESERRLQDSWRSRKQRQQRLLQVTHARGLQW